MENNISQSARPKRTTTILLPAKQQDMLNYLKDVLGLKQTQIVNLSLVELAVRLGYKMPESEG